MGLQGTCVAAGAPNSDDTASSASPSVDEEPHKDGGGHPCSIPTDGAGGGICDAAEAVVEPVLGDVAEADIRMGVRRILQLVLDRKASAIDILVGIVQSSLKRELDVSGPRESHLLGKSMELFRRSLVAVDRPRSRKSKAQRNFERLVNPQAGKTRRS